MRFITLTVVITLAGVNAQGQWGVNQWHQNPNQQWNQNPNQWNTVQPTRQPPAGQPARQPAGQWPAAQPTAQPAAQPARQPARQPMYTNQQQWRGQPMYTNQQQWGAQPNQYNQQQQRPGVHKVANLRPRKRAMMQCFKCTPLPFNLCDPDFVLQVVILREVILDKSNGFDVFNGHKVYQARLQEPYLKATPALDGLLSTYGGPTHDILMLWVKHVDKTCPSPIITPGPMVISGNLVEYQHTVPSLPLQELNYVLPLTLVVFMEKLTSSTQT
uniref:Shell matrix protein n=1 Tax=Laqueus rubellus TaxID=93892 RepID=A0A3G9CM07_LAQRU